MPLLGSSSDVGHQKGGELLFFVSIVVVVALLGSFNNDDSDGHKNVKKQLVRSARKQLHLNISLLSLHHYDVNFP